MARQVAKYYKVTIGKKEQVVKSYGVPKVKQYILEELKKHYSHKALDPEDVVSHISEGKSVEDLTESNKGDDTGESETKE